MSTLVLIYLLFLFTISNSFSSTHCQIHGNVYKDADSSRTTTSDTTSLKNIKIFLSIATQSVTVLVDSTTTNTNGEYSFFGLSGGDYRISVATCIAFVLLDAEAGQYVAGGTLPSVQNRIDAQTLQVINSDGQISAKNNFFLYGKKFRTFVQDSFAVKSNKLKAKKGQLPPMPNSGHARDTLIKLSIATSAAMIIGTKTDSSAKYGWIELQNVKKVQAFFPHTGSARGLDTLKPGKKPKMFSGKVKNLKPKSYNNRLAGEQAALKMNLDLSFFEITPSELGDLEFDNGSGNANPLNGKSLEDIAMIVDSALTYYRHFSTMGVFDSMANTLANVNRAFSGAMDTISVKSKLIIKGTKDITQVLFLRVDDNAQEKQEHSQFVQRTKTLPEKFLLNQNYPNPFNPTTTITFSLSNDANVSLTIFDALGRKIKALFDNEFHESGTYEVLWNASHVSSGIYYYRLSVDGKHFQQSKSMLLLK